jgi:hypothetical protein
LERILDSHAPIHAAEGELFRNALATACEANGLRVVTVPAKALYGRAAAALGLDGSALERRLAEIGKAAGRPWSQDQKESTLAAWIARGS